MEENNVIVWTNKTYIQEQRFDSEGRNYLYGSPIYFDVNLDTSKSSSVEVSDSPIDARNGATLSDKRVVNMKTIGISGKYSSRNTNNSSFKVVENRLGIIIDYFEDALDKQRIYTVCRKGSIYPNMMLNRVNLKFDEHCSTVSISLSFIEVIIIGVDTELQSKVITKKEIAQDIINTLQNYTTIEQNIYDEDVKKLVVPKFNYQWVQEGAKYNLYASVEDNNSNYYNEEGEIINHTLQVTATFWYKKLDLDEWGKATGYKDNTYRNQNMSIKYTKSGETAILDLGLGPYINSPKYLCEDNVSRPFYKVIAIEVVAFFARINSCYTSEGKEIRLETSDKSITSIGNIPQLDS